MSGDIPADIVDRSDHALAFRDINPAAPTHLLIIPIEHVTSMADPVDPTVLSDMRGMAARVAAADGLEAWRLVTNVGAGAGQSVFHLHWHVVGGRPLSWPPG